MAWAIEVLPLRGHPVENHHLPRVRCVPRPARATDVPVASPRADPRARANGSGHYRARARSKAHRICTPSTSAADRIPYGERMARLAFLGTPEMAVPPLRALAGAGHDIALCVTRPDRRRGRGSETTPSPVKEAATELGIPVSHDMDDVAGAGVELAVVVAFGRIIPARLLAAVPMVNLHFSLLPRWRGAAPVERAILAGDRETGVCLMKVEEGLDTGPVYATRRVPIDDRITLDALRVELVDVASALVVDALADGVAALPEPVPQVGRGHAGRQDHPRGPASGLVRRRAAAGAGGATPAGLDHVPGQAAQRARRRGERRRGVREPGFRGNCAATRWSPGAARCACSGCSRRAVLPCQPRSGCAESALRQASVSERTRHESGDTDSD